MAYSPENGKSIYDNYDFEKLYCLSIPVDVQEIDGDGVLTTGNIQKFNDNSVTINDHTYNRHAHGFVSRPYFTV